MVADEEGNSNFNDSSIPEKETYFKLNEDGNKTSITIPNGVKVIKLCASAYADPTIQGVSANSYIRNENGENLVSADALSDNGDENSGSSDETYINVIPGKTYNFYCYVSGLDSGTSASVSISYSKKINSYFSDTTTSSYTAGNLIINGNNTGNTTGNGIITGNIEISASEATAETLKLHKWKYDEDNNINTFDSVDEYFYFSFTTCPNVKYIYLRGGANLEDADDFGTTHFYLKDKTGKELITDSQGQWMTAMLNMAIIKVSPNTQYQVSFDAYGDVTNVYDFSFYVQKNRWKYINNW